MLEYGFLDTFCWTIYFHEVLVLIIGFITGWVLVSKLYLCCVIKVLKDDASSSPAFPALLDLQSGE